MSDIWNFLMVKKYSPPTPLEFYSFLQGASEISPGENSSTLFVFFKKLTLRHIWYFNFSQDMFSYVPWRYQLLFWMVAKKNSKMKTIYNRFLPKMEKFSWSLQKENNTQLWVTAKTKTCLKWNFPWLLEIQSYQVLLYYPENIIVLISFYHFSFSFVYSYN